MFTQSPQSLANPEGAPTGAAARDARPSMLLPSDRGDEEWFERHSAATRCRPPLPSASIASEEGGPVGSTPSGRSCSNAAAAASGWKLDLDNGNTASSLTDLRDGCAPRCTPLFSGTRPEGGADGDTSSQYSGCASSSSRCRELRPSSNLTAATLCSAKDLASADRMAEPNREDAGAAGCPEKRLAGVPARSPLEG